MGHVIRNVGFYAKNVTVIIRGYEFAPITIEPLKCKGPNGKPLLECYRIESAGTFVAVKLRINLPFHVEGASCRLWKKETLEDSWEEVPSSYDWINHSLISEEMGELSIFGITTD
jgi:hypothetical protein